MAGLTQPGLKLQPFFVGDGRKTGSGRRFRVPGSAYFLVGDHQASGLGGTLPSRGRSGPEATAPTVNVSGSSRGADLTCLLRSPPFGASFLPVGGGLGRSRGGGITFPGY